jgi:hypothetical protein
MFRATILFMALLGLISCGAGTDNTATAEAADSSATEEQDEEQVELCIPGVYPGVVQGVLWLDEDITAGDLEEIESLLKTSPFVSQYRYVDEAASDVGVTDFLAANSTDEVASDETGALLLVTLETVSSEEVVGAVFVEFEIQKGVAGFLTGEPIC